MTKSQMLKIALVVVLVAVGIGAVLIFSNSIGFTYANSEKYTAGGADITDRVENLDVNWKSGNIVLVYHAGKEISVTEEGNREITGDDRLRWWLDGTTLRIQYAKSGRFRLFDNLDKTLTISLPEGITLQTAKIHTTSGNIEVPELAAEEAELTVTSGSVSAAAEVRKMKAGATSGDLNLRLGGKTESLTAEVTSGSIAAELGDADYAKVSCTSGGIRISGRVGEAEVSATSGRVDVRLDAFRQLDISVTSGDVTAALPEHPGFACTAEVTSGEVNVGLAMVKEGNTYYCGDRSGKCTIRATSGNIRIEKAD